MTGFDYQAGILRAYAGELIGEGFFARLLDTIDEPERQRKLALLLRLETSVRGYIEPLLNRYRLTLPDARRYRAEGAEQAAVLANWDDFIAKMLVWIPPIEARYQGFLDGGPQEDRQWLELLARHEGLLMQFALEEQGAGAGASLQEIQRMIEEIAFGH